MKVFFLLFLTLPLALYAQQTHQYTQFIFNQFGHNPAVAGSRPCTDLKIGGRDQWTGFEDAPLSLYASVTGRIRQKKNAVVRGYHGLGLYIQRDDTGPISSTILYPAYAYHIRLNANTNLGLGVFAGIQQFRFDRTRIVLPDQTDPAVPGSSSTLIIPDLSAGLWLYSQKAYLGLGVLQAWKKGINGFGEQTKITPHFNFTTGMRFSGEGSYSLIPALMVKYTPLSMPSADLNLMFDYANNFGFGLTYRGLDALAAVVRFKFLTYFNLGYSFDLTHTKMRWASFQTHEISLGIYTCSPKGAGNANTCPAYQ